MQDNTIAIWASVLSANVWSASNHEDGGAYTFIWLAVAVVIFIKDAIAANRITS